MVVGSVADGRVLKSEHCLGVKRHAEDGISNTDLLTLPLSSGVHWVGTATGPKGPYSLPTERVRNWRFKPSGPRGPLGISGP